MSEMVPFNTSYINILVDSFQFATPQIHSLNPDSVANETPDANIGEELKKKLLENDGTAVITESDILFAYDALNNYKKYLQKHLSENKKGTAGYNKSKKALDAIPLILNSFCGSVVQG